MLSHKSIHDTIKRPLVAIQTYKYPERKPLLATKPNINHVAGFLIVLKIRFRTIARNRDNISVFRFVTGKQEKRGGIRYQIPVFIHSSGVSRIRAPDR